MCSIVLVVPEHNTAHQKTPPTAPSPRRWEIGNTSINLQTNAPNAQVTIQETQRSEVEWGRDDSSPGTSL